MTFKPAIWYPIAVVLSVLNLAGVVVYAAEPWHAAAHAAAAVAFGIWAQRLRQRPGESELQTRLESLEGEVNRLDALDAEVGRLRQELSDAQERLDFAERLLAQRPDPRRVGPER
jgi:anti-sigma-K factor RskA